MEKIKLGISREYAIILKPKTNKGTTYEAVDLIEGFFDSETGYFVGENGDIHCHFSTYETDKKEKEYFIGHLQIPEYITIFIDRNPELFKEEYLKKFKEYFYQCRSNGIVCIHKENNKKNLFEDDLTIIHDFTVEATNELQTIIEKLADQLNEQFCSDDENDEDDERLQIKSNTSFEPNIAKTPLEIFNETHEYVKGQDAAIKRIVTNLYQCLKFKNGSKNNMLIIGPTGVGKTYIFETLSKILDLPFIIYSVPGLTQAGYVGRSVDDILVQIITACNGDIEKAKHAIVVLDEIDKLASTKDSNSKIADEGVQNEFLKLIEGDKRLVTIGQGIDKQEIEFDTSNIIFAGTGAFQRIFTEKPPKKMGFGVEVEPPKQTVNVNKEVLFDYGIKPELIGRMPIVVQLRNLEEQDLCDIIMNSKSSRLKSIERLITDECGITITNLDEIVHKIAKNAINENIGARGINSTLAELMDNVYYEIFNHPGEYNELTFGPNFLSDSTDFTLSKKTQVKVRKLTPPKGMNQICEN